MESREGWRSVILDSVDLSALQSHDMKPGDINFKILDSLTPPSDNVRNAIGDAGIIGFGVDLDDRGSMPLGE